jgi:hypothetical protein
MARRVGFAGEAFALVGEDDAAPGAFDQRGAQQSSVL